jgi:asparagine synthetase B (glutamine-hydrolysing)
MLPPAGAAAARNGIGKYMFRQAIRGMVPDQVLTRPKMGFSHFHLAPAGPATRKALCGDVLAPEPFAAAAGSGRNLWRG